MSPPQVCIVSYACTPFHQEMKTKPDEIRQMVHDGQKITQNGQKNYRRWLKMKENGSNWPGMAKKKVEHC